MPKGTKEPTTAKSVYVKFTTKEDLELYEKLSVAATKDRRELGQYILLQLDK